MHKRKTLLLVVLIVATAWTGVGLVSAADHSTSNGWQSCENAPTVGEGVLTVVPETARIHAAPGVTTARLAACGEEYV